MRELKIALERGKVYQFAITATNELGESLKQEEANIKQVKTEGSMFKWILFSPFNDLSFSLLSFQALSVSWTSRFLRVNSSLARTWINEKNFTYVAVDICMPNANIWHIYKTETLIIGWFKNLNQREKFYLRRSWYLYAKCKYMAYL